ncbi:MAG: two-component system phosphate regulon sensor histidine kinase PhoR [Oleiphilaceae bacterium]|jgi:two-component system phosphate regulon sensor histidine kinase PhoR
MKKSYLIAMPRTLLWFSIALLFGWVAGELLLSLLICLTIFLGWNFYQLYQLQKWLLKPDYKALPHSIGNWGAVFDSIRQLQKKQFNHIQKLEGVVEKIKASTKAFRDGALMTNSQGELEWWNEAANSLLDLKAVQDKNQPITNYIRHPEFKAYFDSEDHSEPLEITSPINHEKTLEFYITLVGQKDRLIVCKDLSHLKKLEAMREDFIANASHELRTPLTVISGYLETFLEYQHELPARWGRALSQMNQQSMRMQSLISDLLLLSKLESKDKIRHTRVPLLPLLTQITNDANALSAGKHLIHLDCEDLHIKGIAMELSSAFSNVIFNAVKYTPANGDIHIHCFKTEKSLQLAVKDTGIGIDSIHLSRLTERFYRADPNRHSDTGGTGLGLAIVKHILLRHDGHIEIQSKLGKGSIFICHLPLNRVCK